MPTTTASRPRAPGGAGPPARHYRAAIRRGRVTVMAIVLLGAGAAIAYALHPQHSSAPVSATCTVTARDGSAYTLLPEQAENAATISAVGSRLALPDHAVTIALATALQESKLLNLSYGDRDSRGLFQQRPSQGWGTAAQVSDPTYAATAFYTALRRVPGWAGLPISTAAQRVQRSADGSAYVRWESEGRALAVALTGEAPAALQCSGGTATAAKSASAIRADVVAALGPQAFAAGGPAAAGWRTAAYLVAHAHADGIASVTFGGQRWTAGRGSWRPVGSADSAGQPDTTVTFTAVTFTTLPVPRPVPSA